MNEGSPSAYRPLVRVVRFALWVFFRRIESAGTHHVPAEGGGLLFSWHPNGVVDPALIITQCRRTVVFGARDGLFRIPVFGRLVRALGTVPIYRAEDRTGETSDEARQVANARSLDALAHSVVKGNFSALFPEGISHDHSQPQDLKTGAARLYYRACELAACAGEMTPVLVPVGLHYDRKSVFRSSAFVRFHEPLRLPRDLTFEKVIALPEAARRERYRQLTALLDDVLTQTVHATESWELHAQMERARSLIRAERAHQSGSRLTNAELAEQSRGFARVWHAYAVRVETHPEQTRDLMKRLRAYDRKLRVLGLDDDELDHPPRVWSAYGPAFVVAQLLCLYLLIPPVVVFGFVVNGPPYLLLKVIVRWAAKQRKDEASIKIVVGAALFTVTWLSVAGLCAWGQLNLGDYFSGVPKVPILTFVSVLVFSMLGAAWAWHHKVAMGQTWRALKVRFTRRRQWVALSALRVERAELHDALLDLARGVQLPYAAGTSGVISE